jgi:hypothetical protein
MRTTKKGVGDMFVTCKNTQKTRKKDIQIFIVSYKIAGVV